MRNTKKKIVIALIAVLTLTFLGLGIHIRINLNKNMAETSQEKIHLVPLTENNTSITVENDTATIKKYNGNAEIVVIDKDTIDGSVIKVDNSAFAECHNLDTILIEKSIVGEEVNIEDFKIDTTYEDGKYIKYTTTKQYSEAYKKYLELSEDEKNQLAIIPSKYSVSTSALYSENMEEKYNVSEILSEEIPVSFDLRDKIDIKVENQGSTGICYAYSSLTAVETNLALTHNQNLDFSEVHMAALTSGSGGIFITSSDAYYTDGLGPVYESEWPMENLSSTNSEIYKYLSKSGASLSDSVKEELKATIAKKKVTETIALPGINKHTNTQYTESEMEILRKTIKKHIMKYGSLSSEINVGTIINYNGIYLSNAQSSTLVNHAVSIVGWDDNFSVENFPEENRPKQNGAYLVLNSWGNTWGNGGYYWASYEDSYIESNLSGVITVQDNLDVSIKNLETDEELSSNRIVKGDNIQIQIKANVETLNDNQNEFAIGIISPSLEDITDKTIIVANFIENNIANILLKIDTTNLEIGEYTINLVYGGKIINTTINVTNGSIEGENWYYDVKEKKLYVLEEQEDKSYEYLKDDIDIIEIKDTVAKIFVNQFNGYKNLKQVILPNSILDIELGAFGYCSSLTEITIPEGVVNIEAFAFENCTSLEKVILPETLNKIGKYAFESCEKLREISMPQGLTNIGEKAFYHCNSLTKITIPKGVTNIEPYTFWLCYGLKEVIIEEGVQNISTHAFDRCWSLLQINIPKSVVNIEESAFDSCSALTEITIPEGVINIGESAFNFCRSLNKVIISDKATTIGERAFYYCSNLTEIEIIEGVYNIGKNAFGHCERLTQIMIPEIVNGIDPYAFANNTTIEKVSILKGEISIGEYAFYYCEGLIEIQLPEGIEQIDKHAFDHCTNLTEITIPKSITTIEEYTFYCCVNLRKVIMQEGTTNIGPYSFSNCMNLVDITIPRGITRVGSYAFDNCSSLIEIQFPESLINLGEYTFYNCGKLTEVLLPETLTNIGQYTFFYCAGLKEITIPKGVTAIGTYAFGRCTGLTKIIIEEGITSVDAYAFYDCSRLTEIQFPESLTSLGEYAFNNCEKLSKVVLPEELTNIEKYTFLNCTNLKEMIIPKGVTTIGAHAFDNCTSLTKIIMEEGIISIDAYAFKDCTSLVEVIIPKGAIKLGPHIFYNCTSLKEITIPEGITTISRAAFLDCINLAKITIPETVTTIKQGAFKYCESLEEITLPNSITNIERQAFSGCYKLKKITLPKGLTSINVEMFSNCTSLTDFVIHSNITNIGRLAFKNCENLKTITIPDEVTDIGEDVFTNCDDLTIYCRNNSAALEYAQENNISYTIDEEKPLAGTLMMKLENSDGEEYKNSIWTNKNVYLELKEGSDELSGHLLTTYSINGGEELNESQILTESGTYEIIVTTTDALGNIATNEYTIKIRRPKSIQVDTEPTKMEYKANENFDSQGMIVSIAYDTGDTEATNEYTILNGKNLTCQVTSLEIQHNEYTNIKTELNGIKVGHTEVVDLRVEPTCTKAGLTEGKHCSVCNKVLIEQQVIQELEHNYEGGKCINCGEDSPKIIITSEEYEIHEEYINKILNNTTLEQFKGLINADHVSEIEVLDKNNNPIDLDDIIVTGMTLTLKSTNETKTFKLVVTGDTTGDGVADFKDIVAINLHRLSQRLLQGENFIAGEVTGDGQVDFKDIVKINRFRLNKITQLFSIFN